ncbi:MAG: DedA family protein [Desulfomonilaceae bacterium]
MEIVLHWITAYGYLALFCLLMLGIVGAPFPDDLILAFAGYLVSAGYLEPGRTVASAFLGSLCGISVSYGLGRTVGSPLIEKYGHFVCITANRLNQVKNWYERFGKWGLLFGYFIGGVRHLTAFFAGMSKLRLRVFATFAYTGAFLWSITLISIGYILGDRWAAVSHHHGLQTCIVAGVCVVLAIGGWLAHRRMSVLSPVPAKLSAEGE